VHKRLVAFGDSFTFGNDLQDWNDLTPSKSTWPALLAQDLGLTYICAAEPGASNSSITRSVLSSDITSSDFVVLNWTWIDRWDFYNGGNWETLRPSGTEKSVFARYYYKFFQSELWDKFETLKNIYLVHSLLRQRNITYISTAIDELTLDARWNCPAYIQTLIDQVSSDFIWFENRGFYHWARQHKFEISSRMHPLEDAHREAVAYIKNEITL